MDFRQPRPLPGPLRLTPTVTGEHEQDDQSDNGSYYKWARFIIGHILSAAAVIYEITQLSACFDEEKESLVLDGMMCSLKLCFYIDVTSAVFLSWTYGQPFDIKHVNKIAESNTEEDYCGMCIVHSLAPFIWGIELLFVGVTSVAHSQYSSCGGQGGEGLETYFLLSGLLATMCGLLMVGVSVLTCFLSDTPPDDDMVNWRTRARERNRHYFLTKGRYIEYWCMLQGAIWSYRTGSLGVFGTIIVVVAGFSGVTLSNSAITDAQGMCTGN